MVQTEVFGEKIKDFSRTFFYHILTSSVIYYWTNARQHGIYLLNRSGSKNCHHSNLRVGVILSVLQSARWALKTNEYCWFCICCKHRLCHHVSKFHGTKTWISRKTSEDIPKQLCFSYWKASEMIITIILIHIPGIFLPQNVSSFSLVKGTTPKDSNMALTGWSSRGGGCLNFIWKIPAPYTNKKNLLSLKLQQFGTL